MSDVPPPSGQQPPQQPGQQPPQQPGQQPPPAQQQPPPQQPGPQPPPQAPQAPQPAASGVGQPADLGNRFLAKLIDWILLGVVLGIVWGIMAALFVGAAVGGIGGIGTGGGFLFGLISTVISTAIVLGYFAFMESSKGQTVGKMLLKMKVQTADGQNPSMEEALKRNAYMGLYLANVIPFVGWIIGSLGLLAANIYIAVTINNDTQGRRGWHDEFGGTQVIKVG